MFSVLKRNYLTCFQLNLGLKIPKESIGTREYQNLCNQLANLIKNSKTFIGLMLQLVDFHIQTADATNLGSWKMRAIATE